MSEHKIAFKNAMLYGTGTMMNSMKFSKAMSQYSFGLWYFDDWRCVCEYLKDKMNRGE